MNSEILLLFEEALRKIATENIDAYTMRSLAQDAIRGRRAIELKQRKEPPFEYFS